MKDLIGGLALTLACALLPACASSTHTAGEPSVPRIGWLHGNCLALADDGVRAGTELAVVELGGEARVVSARIIARTDDAQLCPALLADRRPANLAQRLVFYEIDADVVTGLGIGVVRASSRPSAVEDLLDTDGDGQRDTFFHCTTAEGVRFSVWTGDAYHGQPLWEGYYHLGYDTQADCRTDE